MSKLLEIFGRAIAVNTAGLMWQWIDIAIKHNPDFEPIDEVLNLVSLASFDIAAERTSQYLLERPNCTMGRMAAAAICLENSDLTGALENLQSVYLKQPNNTIALYALGHCYERLGKEAEAVEFYQDCLKFKNYLELPRLRLAAIYFKNGQIDRAIREYNQQRYEYPDDIETLVLLGHLHMLNGNNQAAIDAFNSAILIHPDNFSTLPEEEKIKELIECGGHILAIEHINNLLQQQPDSAELYIQLGDIMAQQGDIPEAIVQYEKAVRLQPNMLQGFVKLGSIHLSNGNLSVAAELFNKAAAINDEIVDAYYGLALAQQKTSDNTAAYSTLMLGATIQQNSCILFAEAARLRYCAAGAGETSDDSQDQNSFKTMFENLRQQCRLNPDNQSLLYALSLLYMKIGMYDEAAECFRLLAAKNTTHYRALSRLAFCYVEKEDKSKALSCLDAEKRISDELLKLHYKTSLLYCNRSNFIEALKTTKQQLEENYESSSALNTLNEVLQNMGLIDRAFAGWNVISDIANYAGSGSD
jgi:tetratricopeptide (TPR) repeat protein